MLKMLARACLLSVLGLLSFSGVHAADRTPVQDAVASVIERLRKQLRPYELHFLTADRLERFLYPNERQAFATGHIKFHVDVPVTVRIVRDAEMREIPFWFRDLRFNALPVEWKEGKKTLKVWQRDFEPGEIGLGVNSLSGGGSHYNVLLSPLNPADPLTVANIYPAALRTTHLTNGARPYVDRDDLFASIPAQFAGSTLLQTQNGQRNDARIRTLFRWTDHPAGAKPDQVILTWSDDPKSTQAIQWRTSDRVRKGSVRYAEKSALSRTHNAVQPWQFEARTRPIVTELVVNDSVVRHHCVLLTNLQPATTYAYTVGDGQNWSAPAEFTTAPESPAPFSFIYMGDAQNGLNYWGALLRDAFRSYPEAAFYLVAGDLVNRGHERDDWDDLFYNARGVFDRRTFVPVIGNHDCIGGHPTLYLRFFDLPRNGPPQIEKERAYSFHYSNALFVILDSNLPPKSQTAWLEHQLSTTTATWKFASFHHPAFSSARTRDNKEIRELWGPIFEKYGVDFVLQGHDHAYLRTHPMKNGAPAHSPATGPIYIVSVSGTKMYEQDPLPYTAVGMTNVATYQVFQINGNTLSYRAHDTTGKVRDELVIEKSAR